MAKREIPVELLVKDSATIPPYLRRRKTPAKVHWYRLQLTLDNYSALFDMRIETKEEAVGHRLSPPGVTPADWQDEAPVWEDEEVGASGRAWLLLPYINALDQNALNALLEEGRALIPPLRAGLTRRRATAELMRDWGRFCSVAGALQLVYDHNSNVGHARSAEAGGDAVAMEDHRRWFAHYFLRKYKRGERPKAEEAFERLVWAICDDKIEKPSDYTLGWFEKFLYIDKYSPSNLIYRRLREGFKEHELSVRTMKDLVAQGADGIPPVDLEFPDP